MAVKQHYGDGVVRQRDRLSRDKDGRVTITQVYTGPYDSLVPLFTSMSGSKSGRLSPEAGGQGTLEVTVPPSLIEGTAGGLVAEETLEVLWVELRKKIEEHSFYDDLVPADFAQVEKALEANEESYSHPTKPEATKLWEKKRKGITDYNVGVPVVRRTTPIDIDDLTTGQSWVREDPPVEVPGDWEWMKTTDERRSQGRNVERVEEWTAAEKWDPDHYGPAS